MKLLRDNEYRALLERISELEQDNADLTSWIAYADYLESENSRLRAELTRYGHVLTESKIKRGDLPAVKASNGNTPNDPVVYALGLPGIELDTKYTYHIAPTGHVEPIVTTIETITKDNKNRPIFGGIVRDVIDPLSVEVSEDKPIEEETPKPTKESKPSKAKSTKPDPTTTKDNTETPKFKTVLGLVTKELGRKLKQEEYAWLKMKVEFWDNGKAPSDTTDYSQRAITAIKNNRISKV